MPYPDSAVGPPLDYDRPRGNYPGLPSVLGHVFTGKGNSVLSYHDWMRAFTHPRAALAAGANSPLSYLFPGGGRAGMPMLPGDWIGGRGGHMIGLPPTEVAQHLGDIYRTSRGLPAETGYRDAFGRPQGYLPSQFHPMVGYKGGYTTDFGGPGHQSWMVNDATDWLGTMMADRTARLPASTPGLMHEGTGDRSGISRPTKPSEVINPLDWINQILSRGAGWASES